MNNESPRKSLSTDVEAMGGNGRPNRFWLSTDFSEMHGDRVRLWGASHLKRPDELAIESEEVELVWRAIDGLSPRDHDALLVKLELHPRHDSLASLAVEWQVSRQCVHQRAANAFGRVRLALGIDDEEVEHHAC